MDHPSLTTSPEATAEADDVAMPERGDQPEPKRARSVDRDGEVSRKRDLETVHEVFALWAQTQATALLFATPLKVSRVRNGPWPPDRLTRCAVPARGHARAQEDV